MFHDFYNIIKCKIYIYIYIYIYKHILETKNDFVFVMKVLVPIFHRRWLVSEKKIDIFFRNCLCISNWHNNTFNF